MTDILERDIFGGSDSELSSEDEDGPHVRHERHERRRAPSRESSADSGDEYVQDRRDGPAKGGKAPRREKDGRDEEGGRKKAAKKRKRKVQAQPEIDLNSLPPEQAKRLQVQMKIDAIVKSKKAHRPKKRKKDAEEDALDRFADEEVAQLREEMLRAAQEDEDANREKVPATSKLRMLPRVKEVLQKSSLAQSIIDNNLLEGVRRWLEPLPDKSLPALNIQTFFFGQLSKMYIDSNSLKESGLGRIVLFYTKCRRVTTPISRLANELVSTWSRPIIKRSASYRDKLVPVAAEPDGGSSSIRSGEKLNQILARAKEAQKGRVRKNAVMIPTREGQAYTIAPRETAGLRNNASVDNDTERRRKNAERLRNLTRKVGTKN